MTRAVADVLELLKFNFSGSHRQSGMGTLQCLDCGHLIGTDQMNTLLMQLGGCLIQVADYFNLRLEYNCVIGVSVEPIAIPVRL